MTRQNRHIWLTLLLTLSVATLSAQGDFATLSEYRYDDATQLWRLTDNAAGLGIDTTRNRGYAQIGYKHHSGDYRRVQEGSRSNQLRFETERYQKVGKYLYGYGKFDFDYGRTNDRAWCDVQRAYNSNPYYSGSAIAGKYDFQDFNFAAALATTAIKQRWHFGMKLDYNVGDLSRLRDPRPRSLLLEYKVTPAVTFSFGNSILGLSGNYHRRKEKVNGVKTVRTDATIMYYDMSGMEHATGTMSGYSGYMREWVDHRFGAELTYGYRNRDYRLLAAAAIERGAENVFGQYEREYGKFYDYKYGLSVMNRLASGNYLHELDLKIGYEQAYADEYRQKFYSENNDEKETKTYTYTVRNPDGTISTRDSTITRTQPYTSLYYVTQMILKKRYQVEVFDLDVRYRLDFTDREKLNGYVGARFALGSVKNKYILPESTLRYRNCDFALEGGLQLLGHRLWIDGGMVLHTNGKAKLNLSDPTTDYAVYVLTPDMEYYQANYFQGRLAVTYNFPLKIKGKQTSWYVRADGDWLRTNNNRHAASAGITLGILN